MKTEVQKQAGKTAVLLRDVLLFDGKLLKGSRFIVGQKWDDGCEPIYGKLDPDSPQAASVRPVARVELKWSNGKVAVSGLDADAVAFD